MSWSLDVTAGLKQPKTGAGCRVAGDGISRADAIMPPVTRHHIRRGSIRQSGR